MKSNIPPFYPGEEIIYITGKNMPKGTECKVYECVQLPCGCWCVDIGTKSDNAYVECRFHGPNFKLKKRTNVEYWVASSFVSKHKRNFPLMTFEKIKEKEQQYILTNN